MRVHSARIVIALIVGIAMLVPGATAANAATTNTRVATVATVATSSGWLQHDCGWTTCTIRFDRASTRNARDAAILFGMMMGACAAMGGAAIAICGIVGVGWATVYAVYASRYYEDGGCLGVKFFRFTTTSWPTRVAPGHYNCF